MPNASIILPPTGQRRVIYPDGNTSDIIRVILFADRQSGQYVDADQLQALRGPDDYHTLENIYWFVKKNVKYRADRSGQEDVRSPGYLFQSAVGDCKSLSVAIGALCRAFGIPYRYRFIRQAGARNYHHVYVVATCPDGGGEVLLDAVHRNFNAEPDHRQKLDMKPGQRVPAGIGYMAGTVLEQTWPILVLLLLWFAFSKVK